MNHDKNILLSEFAILIIELLSIYGDGTIIDTNETPYVNQILPVTDENGKQHYVFTYEPDVVDTTNIQTCPSCKKEYESTGCNECPFCGHEWEEQP